MKTLAFLLLTCSILLSYSYRLGAQSNIQNEQIIKMLKEFYIVYNKVLSDAPSINYMLINKIDSLQCKYCTKKLRNELRSERKEFGFGFDPLIKDEYAEVLNMLKVTKDSTRSNVYIVSYCYPTENASYKPINKTVTFHVLMMKEDGNFKIDSVW